MMQWHSNNTKFTLSQRGPECSTKKPHRLQKA